MLNCIFFPGSFNPFTKGHADILERLLALAERVVVGIGINADKPESQTAATANANTIESFVSRKGLGHRVNVTVYTGLTMEAAREWGAQCVARGVRSAADFEYEYALAAANREAFGLETILIPADPALSYVSSTIIRDLQKHGGTEIAEKFLP